MSFAIKRQIANNIGVYLWRKIVASRRITRENVCVMTGYRYTETLIRRSNPLKKDRYPFMLSFSLWMTFQFMGRLSRKQSIFIMSMCLIDKADCLENNFVRLYNMYWDWDKNIWNCYQREKRKQKFNDL